VLRVCLGSKDILTMTPPTDVEFLSPPKGRRWVDEVLYVREENVGRDLKLTFIGCATHKQFLTIAGSANIKEVAQ